MPERTYIAKQQGQYQEVYIAGLTFVFSGQTCIGFAVPGLGRVKSAEKPGQQVWNKHRRQFGHTKYTLKQQEFDVMLELVESAIDKGTGMKIDNLVLTADTIISNRKG